MPRNFIIIDPDPIVSMDLEEMLLSQFPAAQVVTFGAMDAIATALNVTTPDTTLFVRGAWFVQNDEVARMVRNAASYGSSVVIIGESGGVDIPGQVIDLPFTNEMILQKITALTPPPDMGELHKPIR